jgi:hypothetical protein
MLRRLRAAHSAAKKRLRVTARGAIGKNGRRPSTLTRKAAYFISKSNMGTCLKKSRLIGNAFFRNNAARYFIQPRLMPIKT